MHEIKILILSCGTGGGHNSAALAIQEKLLNKNIKADFVEYLDIIDEKVKNRVNKMYINSTKGNGNIFKVAYHLGELYEKTKLKSPVYQLNALSKNKLYEYIKENEYDYVIVTHLFPAQALTAVNKEHKVKFMAVATDYVSIPFWEETDPDYFVIPSEELKSDFIKKGIIKEKLLSFGIPVKETYTKEYDVDECKKKLGLDLNKKYVLILTGSMGFGNTSSILKKLISKIENVNYIVACGNNIKLYENLNEEYSKDSRIIALPFTLNISEYMKSSDVILTKPGGLTTTEIANLRKPFIHTMPIPGCENYNADFFETRKMSLKCESEEEIITKTKELINNETLQKEMIDNQKRFIRNDTCDKIVEFILKEIEEKEK